MHPAALIHNPLAGRNAARQLQEIEAALRRRGFALDVRATTAPRDATLLARQAVAAGAELVFGLGGDGTLREIAAGIIGSETVLVPLPAGTANVLALSLGLPSSPLAVIRGLDSSSARLIDVGLCSNEPFLMQASAGLDARVMARVPAGLKRRLGRGAVGWTGLREWWRYDYPEIEATSQDRRSTATFVAVCNTPHYAGSPRLFPAARLDDGRLDLVLFRGSGRRATLSFAWSLVRGRHLARSDVEHRDVESVVLDGPAGLEFQLDGDAFRFSLPLTIAVAEKKLRILGASARETTSKTS